METIVKSAMAPLRAFDSKTAERTDEVLHGWKLNILSSHSDYYFVETKYGYKGYINKSDVELTATSAKKLARIAANFADATSRPITQGNVLITLPKGSMVTLLGSLDKYSHILLANGQKAYIRKDFLEDINLADMPEDKLRQKVMKNALSYLGTQYRWGGKTPKGIDCSGLMFMAYHLMGINIWRDAYIKEGYNVRKISFSEAKPADLLYFPGHVAMLLPHGKIIHSTDAKNAVVVEDVDKVSELMEKILYCGTVL